MRNRGTNFSGCSGEGGGTGGGTGEETGGVTDGETDEETGSGADGVTVILKKRETGGGGLRC